MPWATLSLKDVRVQVRGEISAALAGASYVGNSVLRVMADATAAMAHLVLRYLDWQSRQYLPDTAESEWLDRHADIWLHNADGTIGRKVATLARGIISLSGSPGFILPTGTQFQSSANLLYETTEIGTFGSSPIDVPIIAIDPGTAGNLDPGEPLAIVAALSGIDTTATVVELEGGTDAETDAELRVRVLERIQKPPMGGDADDYVAWALSVPGVTRAWCSPLEMGVGTVTVRFMMDDLRASNHGFPTPDDVAAVAAYLDSVRPVAVEDFFVEAPIPEFINFQIVELVSDDASTRAAIEISVDRIVTAKAAPAYAVDGVPQEAQTIYREWVSVAISETTGVDHFDLVMDDHPMPNAGCIGILGDITYGCKHVRRSASDYAVALANLLPVGYAWSRDPSTALMQFVTGLAAIWGYVDGRCADLLERETDPRLTLEMLSDWERAYGLPEKCLAEPLTIHDRQAALVARITMKGAQSREFIIALAASLLYTITIEEFAPFMAGVSQAGDTRPLGSPYFRWYIGPPEMRFYWTVHVSGARLTWFRATAGQAGVDPHLRIGLATDLEWILRRIKPAHTEIIFDYSGAGLSDPMAGTP